MGTTFETLIGKAIEWKGRHHSPQGDFGNISTHTVCYETENSCYVIAQGKLAGEARYQYKKMDARMAALIYYPELYQGRRDVVLYAMLDFEKQTDRAVILAGGEPFAIAEGSMRMVETPSRP